MSTGTEIAKGPNQYLVNVDGLVFCSGGWGEDVWGLPSVWCRGALVGVGIRREWLCPLAQM